MYGQQTSITFMAVLGVSMSIYVFCSQRKHLIATLLSLEGAVISMYFMISMASTKLSSNFIFIFLTLVVCEAALGLAILVAIVRTHNNDFLNSLSSSHF
uniref:NADH dehydrogenase subunit 4L n=1 Tax=Leptestheria dahalacensis TaxID=202083 RepID=UPI0022A79B61|nr:NADH dehydrogenase subunit 4L [Leptestheria dahalacensis]UNY33481.1 NADH dehydrogenase subunit 4L [Leptestheria dahalacensis]